MNRFVRTLLLAGLALWCFTAQAQSTRLRAANKQFDNLSYVSAVRMYEEFLRADRKKDPAETREAMIKLGYSYRKLQDYRNAERVYGDLIKENNLKKCSSFSILVFIFLSSSQHHFFFHAKNLNNPRNQMKFIQFSP